MFDSLFTGVLTIGLLGAGAIAFGSDIATEQHQAAASRIVTLPTVTIVAHRAAPTAVAVLPTAAVDRHARADALRRPMRVASL